MLAIDKISSALDIAFCVQLVASLSEDRVLVAIESDAVIALLGIVSTDGTGLRTGPIGVFQIDVVDFGICSSVLECARGFVIGGTASDTGAELDIHDITGV